MKIIVALPLILCSTVILEAASVQTPDQPSQQTTTTFTKRIHIIPAPQDTPADKKKSSQIETLSTPCTKSIPHKKVGGRQEFAVAATLPLHGEISLLGKQVLFGTNLYFDKLKKEIGSHNLPLFKFFFLDNNAQAFRARNDLKDLSVRSPALLNLFGTEIIVALNRQITAGHFASFFPIEGLDSLRTQAACNTIYLRASYEEELEALINYTVNTLNRHKIALFYEASDFGEGILACFNKVLKQHDLTAVATGAYPENTVNIAQACTSIMKGGPNAIICASGARPAYNFISQMINQGLHRCTFLGLSPLFAIQKTLIESRGVQVIVSSVVPDPFKSTIPIAQEYRTAMKKYLTNKTVSPSSFESYLNAALFAHATAQTKPPITVRNVMATLEQFDNVEFKGLRLTFNPSTRSLSHNVWLNAGGEKEWVLAEQIDQ